MYRMSNKDKISVTQKNYRERNKDKLREYRKDYYEKNRTAIRKKQREYYIANSEHIKDTVKAYSDNNKERIRERRRKNLVENGDAIREKRRAYWRKHAEEFKIASKIYREKPENKKKRAVYVKNRKKTDPKFCTEIRIRGLIGSALRRRGYNKHTNTYKIIGCNYDDLWEHLKKTWEKNYGKLWDGEPYHIDHITPLATAKTEDDVIRLFHYTNLQLLTPKDNLIKGAKKLQNFTNKV